MFIALIYSTLAMFALLFLSVFKKHMLVNGAVVFLCLGILIIYEQLGYPYSFWVDAALVLIAIFQMGELAKGKTK